MPHTGDIMAVNMLDTRVSLGVICRSKRPSLFCALTKKEKNRLLAWALGERRARGGGLAPARVRGRNDVARRQKDR